ncbi:hypothetical protein [Yinghuangia seranimata]|uniref:hypothetical protein n=1 Tax=Yinghuangia seranimata TaxID=408067 RepID=UPI00248C63E9|nr:hypothetical protein [Yinghuangia seranimata]MDI2125031.1 hypothetical protein [Yinghuangia seranimata]
MNRSRARTAMWGAVCLGLLAAFPGAAQAAGSGAGAARPTTPEEIGALPPAEQNKILDPLRAAAGALDEQGREAYAAVYAGVRLNAVAGTVEVFTKGDAKALVAAAHKASPGVNLSMVRTKAAKYTKAELYAARERVQQ